MYTYLWIFSNARYPLICGRREYSAVYCILRTMSPVVAVFRVAAHFAPSLAHAVAGGPSFSGTVRKWRAAGRMQTSGREGAGDLRTMA